MKRMLTIVFAALLAAQSWAAPFTFDDITFWVGSGSNESAMVVDWFDGSTDESLVWGYRWDGAATGEDMLFAILAADPRLYAKVSTPGGFGVALYGMGYDANNDGSFSISDGTVFDADGVDVTGPADGAVSNNPADYYAEGWFTGFWHYGLATGNPFDGGSWSSALVGMSGRDLSDGSWDSWAYDADFSFTDFAQNPVAATAVPEASSFLLVAGAFLSVLFLRRRTARALALSLPLVMSSAASASPYATEVVSYTAGTPVGVGSPAPYQTNGSQAIGSPARDAGFGSQVGVFYPAFRATDLVIVGVGGQLTVKFDHPVLDHHWNPFGIDLLVFGNAFYVRNPTTLLATGVFEEPGRVSVSQDGLSWFDIPALSADVEFPTLGYTNTVYNGSGNFGGTILTDFTLPVDPSFNAIGKTEAQINAGYNGSGGGAGIDLADVGLEWIQYVRISQPSTDTWSTEIDAFADVAAVPEASTIAMMSIGLGVATVSGWIRRRNRKNRIA